MKPKHAKAHMKSAFNYAECSTAERLKVGCVIVKDDRIISIGYNGMPSGWTNVCEDNVLWLEDKQLPEPITVTKPEVIHAEANAVCKLARSNESGEGALAFITHEPCLSCAKLLYSTGIVEVYYAQEIAKSAGIHFLKECKVRVDKL